jgi:hypothetical protein
MMRGKKMMKYVTACRFADAGFPGRLLDRSRGNGLMAVMPMPFPCYPTHVVTRCQKNPLPTAFFPSIRVVTVQGVWENHTPQAFLDILLVLPFYGLHNVWRKIP